MKDKEQFFVMLVNECLNEMYVRSFPSITIEDFDEIYKECPPEEQNFRKHYLPKEIQNEIVDYFINEFDISDKFKDHLDYINGCILEGFYKKVYNEDGKKYVKTLPLQDLLKDKDDVKIIEELLSDLAKEHTRDYKAERFRFNVWNWAPSENKKEVMEYWKSQGVDYDESNFDDKNFPSIWEEEEPIAIWNDLENNS